MVNEIVPLFADLAILLVMVAGLLFIAICLLKLVRLSLDKLFQSGERMDKNCNECKWVYKTGNYGNWCKRPHRLSGDALYSAHNCSLERSWFRSLRGGCGPEAKFWEVKE